uniref:UHRF1 tandem tudor domain-containing protein n=1 Tax=Romanomermis culicivorax TaxID=13658 RepID=A0A915J4P1_ROMCU
MFVVRHPVTGQSVTVTTLTRLSPIQDLRSFIYREFSIDSENILVRLYARGKELMDGCTFFDYSLREGEVIFFNLKPIAASASEVNVVIENENMGEPGSVTDVQPMTESKYFRVGAKVDVCSAENGAWYEAVISAIVPRSTAKVNDSDDELEYHCTYESYGKSTEVVNLSQIVPRMHKKLAFEGFDPSTFTKNVLVNYNFDSPGQLGDWYKGVVRRIADSKRRSYALICDLMTE